MDLKHPCILRYLEHKSEVIIPDEIETIDEGCFEDCDWISSVTFGPIPKLTPISARAFCGCLDLQTITIPSSVTFLGGLCFGTRPALRSVSFCARSQLRRVSKFAFCACASLESIAVPSTVTEIGTSCLFGCEKLQNLTFPVDSELVRIEDNALARCHSLESLFLPSSVEFVGVDCFDGCKALSSLTFGLPSHLRELLDIPSPLEGFVRIPDSVEVLCAFGTLRRQSVQVLIFGDESSLNEVIRVTPDHSRRHLSFLRVSSRSLKRFRMNLEFATDF
jgi:hypothetical protein